MLSLAPIKAGKETEAEALARYSAVADAVETVATDPTVEPLFDGPRARLKTAQLLLAVAIGETHIARDADVGPCIGKRCDTGRSACVMQINVGAGKTAEGWTREELFADRVKCVTSGANRIRQSMGMCRRQPFAHRLADFSGGMCESPRAQASSERKMRLFERISKMPDAPSTDLPMRLR